MINVGIVDDDALVRADLSEFLNGYADICVVGEAANGREAADLLRRIKPHVLMLDLMMPGQSGQHVLTTIKAIVPDLPVLILSNCPEKHYAISLIRNGASGYLNKDCAADVMIDALRTVASGRHYFTPSVADLLLPRLGNSASSVLHEQLTAREFQVFMWLARGKDTPAICHDLCLSVNTIDQHRRRLLRKMNLRTNGDLMYYAIKNRLINDPSDGAWRALVPSI